jgi:hypothetical protein
MSLFKRESGFFGNSLLSTEQKNAQGLLLGNFEYLLGGIDARASLGKPREAKARGEIYAYPVGDI